MGNSQAVACIDRTGGSKAQYLNKYLTPQQIQLVQGSWDIMKEDLPTLGVTVFLSETQDNVTSIKEQDKANPSIRFENNGDHKTLMKLTSSMLV
ncbi:hypothetical protein ACOMHN_040312 [Nucella lapillus]